MNRRSPILIMLALLGLVLFPSCSDTPVDSSTANITLRDPRDSVVIRDSIRITDSLHMDTVEVPRDAYRKGMIYFKLNNSSKVNDSLALEIDPYTYAFVAQQGGAPKTVAIRMIARVPEKSALTQHGLPSWMYLNVDKVTLNAKTRGERGLESDPRNNLTGLAVFARQPWSPLLQITEGQGRGHLSVDTVMMRERRVHISFNALCGGSPLLPIDSVALQLGF